MQPSPEERRILRGMTRRAAAGLSPTGSDLALCQDRRSALVLAVRSREKQLDEHKDSKPALAQAVSVHLELVRELLREHDYDEHGCCRTCRLAATEAMVVPYPWPCPTLQHVHLALTRPAWPTTG